MSPRWDPLLFPFLLPLAACAAARTPPAEVERGVRATLDAQVAAWNRGDVRGFMDGYLRSPDTTFLSGTHLERGFDPVLARFLERYPQGKMGTLEFHDVEVRPLGDGSVAYVLGRYRLRGDATQSGAFSLVFVRVDGGYRVAHDHTSADPEPEGAEKANP